MQRHLCAKAMCCLLLATAPNAQDFARRDGLLILEGGREMPRSNKAILAIAIMIGAVERQFRPHADRHFGTGRRGPHVRDRLRQIRSCLRSALSAKVIVLVAASIALGKLVLVSGAAEWIGGLLASAMQFLPAAGVLAAIMLFVTV